MKIRLLLSCSILLLFQYGYSQEKMIHIPYSIEGIADDQAIKDKILESFVGYSKDYFNNNGNEILITRWGGTDEVIYNCEANSSDLWMYISNGEQKLKTKISPEFYEGMKEQMNRSKPEYSKLKDQREILGVKGNVTTIKMQGRVLEHIEASSIPSNLPFSLFLELEGSASVVLSMEIIPPQRSGSKSLAKLRIAGKEIRKSFDASLMDIDKDSYELKTMKEIEAEMGLTYMFALLF